MSKIRTRFAPSPTGHLHVGGSRTALFNFLLARSQGGEFVLRIEDTDLARSEQVYTDAILEAMVWLGMNWDGEVVYQSQRLPIHMEYLDKLIKSGHAYWCHCTSEELEARRELALKEGRKPKYDGKCCELALEKKEGAVLRFKTPQTGSTGWTDGIKGPIVFNNEELDDLVILKSDGSPTYNFAVVVDDATMGITHVIRGDDHVNNTPRQILLYQALGLEPPVFAHMPLTLGADKTRLSKRHGATSVMAYKEMGYLPEALVNFFARLGWSHGDDEIFSMAELIQKFSLASVGQSPGVFDMNKLIWLNSHYIKTGDPARLAALLEPFLIARGVGGPLDLEYLSRAVITLQTRSKTLVEMAEAAEFYFWDAVVFDEAAKAKFLTPDLAPVMTDLMNRLKALSDFTEAALETIFADLVATYNQKMGKIAQPVRVALTGKTVSPGLFEIMTVLGKDKVLARLDKGLAIIQA